MKARRKTGVICCVILCLMLCFVGCSRTKVPEEISVPALSVTSKGQVTAWLIEDFDKDYYDLKELRAMVDEEVAAFNKNHTSQEGMDAVTVQSLAESTDGSQKVTLVLQFRDTAAYKDYTGADLFYGTVTQAMEAGYDLDVQLISTKDGTTIEQTEIQEKGKNHILIAQEKVLIYGPAKPLYISPGTATNEDGSVEVSENAEDNIYIIMK